MSVDELRWWLLGRRRLSSAPATVRAHPFASEPAWLREATALLKVDPSQMADGECSIVSPQCESHVHSAEGGGPLSADASSERRDLPLSPREGGATELPSSMASSSVLLGFHPQPGSGTGSVASSSSDHSQQSSNSQHGWHSECSATRALSARAQGKLPMRVAQAQQIPGADKPTCAMPAPALPPLTTSGAPEPLPLLAAAGLRTLSPIQRAVLDQAIFFGMDLQAASALCGNAGSGGGAARSTSSAASMGSMDSASHGADLAAHPTRSGSVRQAQTGQHPASEPMSKRTPDVGTALDAAPPARSSVNVLRRANRALVHLLAHRQADGASHILRGARWSVSLILRLFAYAEAAASRAVAILEATSARALDNAAGASLSAMGGLMRAAAAIALPIWTGIVARALHAIGALIRRMRRSRAGWHASNGAGAIASLVVARGVILGGPIVGALIASPLQVLWFAAGLQDIRVFLLFMVCILALMLRCFASLGWLE